MNVDLDLSSFRHLLTIKREQNTQWVYDIIRKKDIVLQPEEFVRQCIIHFLTERIGISKNLIKSEKGIKVNGLFRRCDLIIYDRNALPLMIIEVKRPNQPLNQQVFNQVAMYNIPLQVPYLMVSNGPENYICKLDLSKKEYEFLQRFPDREELFGKL